MEQIVEYRGAIHIHSRYSDGSGSLRKIIRDAQRAGLDFIIVTDHDTLRAKREGWEGWHDGVLTLVGVEVTPIGGGHCLGFGVRHCARMKVMAPKDFIADIRSQGGVAFLAHPQGKPSLLTRRRMEVWKDWDLDTYTGFELWSYMHNWIDGLRLWDLPRAICHPEGRITGPASVLLQRWDQLTQRRRVVAIAGLDAHAQRLPFSWVRVFNYDYLFRTLRTHVLSQPFTHNFEEDVARLREGIEQGRCFVANDLLADSKGFVFCCRRKDSTLLPMGAESPWQAGDDIRVKIPQKALIRLLCNGEILAAREGTELAHPVMRPGVYRVEVFIAGKPWIFSNPLYLR